MKVWWCLEHSASFQMEADPNPPTWGCYASEPMTCLLCEGSGLRAYISPRTVETGESEFVSCGRCLGSGFVKTVPQAEDCRMVEMQLVPADARMVSGEALVIEKENGEWPEEVIDKAASAFDNSDRVARRLAIACLDALSVPDPTKTEPPKDPWDYDP